MYTVVVPTKHLESLSNGSLQSRLLVVALVKQAGGRISLSRSLLESLSSDIELAITRDLSTDSWELEVK